MSAYSVSSCGCGPAKGSGCGCKPQKPHKPCCPPPKPPCPPPPCVTCDKRDRENCCDLDTSKLAISYEKACTPVKFGCPRRYTFVEANGVCTCFSLYVGECYSKCLLEEARCSKAQILGSWKQSSECGKYKINVTVAVPDQCDKDGYNDSLCKLVNKFLQSVALAESGLLCRYPGLACSSINVRFVSVDSCGKKDKFDRIECWGTLKDWVCCKEECGCN